MSPELQLALGELLESVQDQGPLSMAEIRRLTIKFVYENIEGYDLDEIEAMYDEMYAAGKV